jgi:hypothetical protein
MGLNEIFDTIRALITPEVEAGIKILIVTLCLLHFLWSVILSRQVVNATNTIRTRNAAAFRFLSFLHIAALTAVLLLVIFF